MTARRFHGLLTTHCRCHAFFRISFLSSHCYEFAGSGKTSTMIVPDEPCFQYLLLTRSSRLLLSLQQLSFQVLTLPRAQGQGRLSCSVFDVKRRTRATARSSCRRKDEFLPSPLTSAPPILIMLFTSRMTMGLFLGGSCAEKSHENRLFQQRCTSSLHYPPGFNVNRCYSCFGCLPPTYNTGPYLGDQGIITVIEWISALQRLLPNTRPVSE